MTKAATSNSNSPQANPKQSHIDKSALQRQWKLLQPGGSARMHSRPIAPDLKSAPTAVVAVY